MVMPAKLPALTFWPGLTQLGGDETRSPRHVELGCQLRGGHAEQRSECLGLGEGWAIWKSSAMTVSVGIDRASAGVASR